MPNGRILPSALMFDVLLVRAWNMAMNSFANAERFSSTDMGDSGELKTDLDKPDHQAPTQKFLSGYLGNEAASEVISYNRALPKQMQEVAEQWAKEFEGIIEKAAPVGAGYLLATQWLNQVINGSDGLGDLGYARHLARAQVYSDAIENSVNQRQLPTPPGAMDAMKSVARRAAGLHINRAAVQMQADRQAEAQKLRIDAAEALIRARNEALDAAMEYTFTQVNLMFDVFGRNNDFLVDLRRKEDQLKARLDIRSAELATWESRIQTVDDSVAAEIQKIKAIVARLNTLDEMSLDSRIRILRRYSSRAAAALNSAGVSVNSVASESNNISSGN